MKAPAAAPAEKPPAYVVRMRPALAAQIVNRAFARIPWPQRPVPDTREPLSDDYDVFELERLPLSPGARLFLVEFNGAPTGRADLVSVESAEPNGMLLVRRGYCQHQGKHDEDLTAVGYRSVPTSCVMLEALPEPSAPAPTPGAHVVPLDGIAPGSPHWECANGHGPCAPDCPMAPSGWSEGR